jgi:uncharacterized protein YkwD
MQLPARLGRASLRAAALALLALAMLPAAPAAAKKTPRCAHADDAPTARTLSKARRATMCLVNRERRKHGLRSLRTNRRLQASATRYAREMVSREFFAHVTPGGETFTERIRQDTRYLTGALRWEIGENLAWGTGSRATPAQIVRSWMRSPDHRRNILHASYREMGLGIALGAPVRAAAASTSAATYANQFGARGR